MLVVEEVMLTTLHHLLQVFHLVVVREFTVLIVQHLHQSLLMEKVEVVEVVEQFHLQKLVMVVMVYVLLPILEVVQN